MESTMTRRFGEGAPTRAQRTDESARLIERTAQLLHEARERQEARYAAHVPEYDLVYGSKRAIARSRELLRRPVFHPYKEAVT